MDSFRKKTKKDHRTIKHVDKEKSNQFIHDMRAIKENIKINELLRSVKINSSMRIKAPHGKKVMENEDLTEDNSEKEPISEQVNCNTSSVVKQEENVCSDTDCSEKDTQENNGSPGQSVLFIEEEQKKLPNNNDINSNIETAEKNNGDIPKVTVEEISEEQEDENKPTMPLDVEENNISEEVKTRTLPVRNDSTLLRDRKLSLDHTMLSRMQSMSQSEIDLHSMGKSPLERKSSFFRKKMDNFLKNTTEVFRRHSSHYKGQPVQRRGSMSVSLQSLNENDNGRDFNLNCQGDPQGSTTSLQTCSTLGRSSRSEGLDQGSMAGSQSSINAGQTAFTSQPIIASDSIKNLTDPYLQESPLNSRAISMSSGLDSVQAHRRSTRSKRVTWVASESLNNYLKRLIPDEIKKDPVYHSQQDLSSIKEVGSYSISKTDTKGRRLSYQRAVSGEDPAPWLKHHDANQKRKNAAAENQETALLLEHLHHFTQFGVPPIRGYTLTHVPEETFWCLSWAERVEEFQEFFEWKLRRKEIDDLDRLHRMRGFENFRFFHEPFDIRMTPNEEARQAVIRELIVTEAVYIKHLYAIVEVFIASAHALQDSGKLLDINTERLFANIPDILNASLQFFTATFNPMIIDAIANNILFNTEEMYFGFCHFKEWFMPYEKYVCGQSKALDYLRSLGSHHNFMIYLQWCHAQAACNRLQLTDIMVKPMQRLTKYSILLRRILQHTENEPERSALVSMDLFASNYAQEVNRSVRQREELEIIDHLNTVIEPYDVESKDEELDRWFRVFANVNLKAPMLNSLPWHSRSLIFQGDLRFKDHLKEMDVRAILLTDMLLICKKQNKGQYQYKITRPKYMVDKLNYYQRFAKGTNDINGLVFVVVDEVGSGYGAFTLSEPKDKDPSVPPGILKTWELKFREAKLTYELGVWCARNPSRDLSEAELETFSTYPTHSSKGGKLSLEEATIEREARERVATMLHRSYASTKYENSMKADSFDVDADMSYAAAARMHMHRNPMFRTSTAGSSRQSRLSSFQHSISAHSHDEPQPGPSRCDYRAGTSVEHLIPPQHPSDGVTSITVNVVSESESASVVSVQPPPTLQMLKQKSPMSRNSLRVQPSSGAMALVHSLPDLSLEAPRTPSAPCKPNQRRPAPISASDKMYQSHQELLLKNRLLAQSQHQHQYLSPDSRGTSYPPPSPTRASLRRGLAFSYSMKNPPLSKMGHVHSQSTQPDTATASGSSTMSRDERGAINPFLVPTPEKQDKKSPDKKSKHFSSRNKGSGASSSGASSSRSREDRAE